MGLPVMDSITEQDESQENLERKDSRLSKDSHTASDYIDRQLELEADAREVLPYKFDSCSRPLGPLRQNVFACLTCSPPPASPAQVYTPAGICYSCSISCHGEHTLVELFARRNFVCDCGTTRMPSTSPCTLRIDANTAAKGVHSEDAAQDNHYNHNFQNRFCGCGEEYDAEREKGTMFQCLGLGPVENGGCGEDWWHPECLMGLPRDLQTVEDSKTVETKPEADQGEAAEEEHQLPPGFPSEDDFETIICYKCVESNPWIKQYAGTPGFLSPVYKQDQAPTSIHDKVSEPSASTSLKRKAIDEDDDETTASSAKRTKSEDKDEGTIAPVASNGQTDIHLHKHDSLPPAPNGVFSLFLKEDFREHLCHCPKCFPNLLPHQQLLEEEETYQPSVSDSEASDAGPGSGTRSHATGSLLDRGEAALSGVDRVRAIEGVMVYNHLKDKVKEFLKPYAESGKAVGAEDIKAYFEKLRGDEAAIKEAGSRPDLADGDEDKDGDNRREQSGY